MLERPGRSVILFVAASLLAVACSTTRSTGSVAPSPVVVLTASPQPSVSSSPAEAPVPVCNDRKPPWVEAANSARDGPDPAGRIVFGQVSRDDVPFQVVDPLFAIDPDGSDLVQVLSCDVERPRISHDGTRLAFSLFMSDGTWQIATRGVDGSDFRILTATKGWAEMPDWAPDDSWLAYARIVFGCDGNLCLTNADGSKVVTLVGPVGFELNHFAWGTAPKAAP